METTITGYELLTKRIDDLCKKKNRVKNKKMTPYRISKNGGMNPSTLNNILDGTYTDPKFSTIIKICKGLDMSLKEFFDDELFE